MSAPPAAGHRIVTTSDGNGISKITIDEPIENKPFGPGGTLFGRVWQTSSSPADAQAEEDGAKTGADTIVSIGGSNLIVVSMPPKSSSPMHFTNSIDYAIVTNGNPILEVSDGSRRKLSPGDIVVQRATLHAWHNESESEWTKIVFTTVEAKTPSPAPQGLHLD